MVGMILALATGVLALVPSLIHFRRNGPSYSLVLPLTGLYYFFFYAFPVFLFDPRHWVFWGRDEAGIHYGMRVTAINEEAQLVLLIGLAALISVYYSSISLFRNYVPHFGLPHSQNTIRLRVLLGVLLAAHLAYKFLPALQEVNSIGQFLIPVGPFAAAMLLLLSREAQSRFLSLGVLVIIVLLLGQTVANGLLTYLVLFCGFLAVVLYHVRSRWCWLFVILPFAIIMALYSPLTQSRPVLFASHSGSSSVQPSSGQSSSGQSSSGLSSSGQSSDTFGLPRKVKDAKRIVKISEMAIDYWSENEGAGRTSFTPLILRISSIVLFSHIFDKTPEEVPFMGGASYSPLATSLIPRLLWPDKPKEQFGQIFGHRYRLIWPSDKRTSMNVPWVVEMYVNFGIPGVVFGMAIIGALLAILVSVFNNPSMSSLEFVTGTAVIYWLAYPHANLSVMTGSLLQLAICLWLYFRIGLSIGKRTPSY